MSESRYRKLNPQHFVVFNAQIVSRGGRVLGQVDLDLTKDAATLTEVARQAGEDLFVLYESHAFPAWKPLPSSLARPLRNAIWWTQAERRDEDLFLPVDSPLRQQKRVALNCRTGRWRGNAAYSLDLWGNPDWECCNYSGAVVELACIPPKHLCRTEDSTPSEEFMVAPSTTRGRSVRPVFFHRTGLLEYVWFSHGAALPAILYDNSVALLGPLRFKRHRDAGAIHIHRSGKFLGYIWPCDISAPEAVAKAQAKLRKLAGRNARNYGFGRADDSTIATEGRS
jgi:hypothetical protein